MERKIVRVYLEEDVELRQLGLTNTFRSLTIDSSSTVEEVENGIRGKMATGRTPMQVDFLKQCCGDFQLFAVYETGANNAWRCPLQECDLVWGITTQERVRCCCYVMFVVIGVFVAFGVFNVFLTCLV
jgi:hypothetical protein